MMKLHADPTQHRTGLEGVRSTYHQLRAAASGIALTALLSCATFTAHAQLSLSKLSPSTGSTTTPTLVQLTGVNLSPTMSVWFGAQQASIVTYNGPTSVVVEAPAQSASEVEVGVILSPTNRASLGYAFTYAAQSGPVLTSVSPSSGSANTAVAVVLKGANFKSGSGVRVGGSTATNVSVTSSSQITATIPGKSAGSYTVEVVNPDNSVTSLVNGFNASAALKIIALPAAAATLGQAYNAIAEAAGGTAPYTWAVNSGVLPPGLAGTVKGVVSGAPTSAGTYGYVAQVQDAKGVKATASGAITVQKKNSPKTSPSGTGLSSCQAINASGSYYLTGDVTCTTQGFAINADNVTLDLNNHTITYGNASSVVPAVSICDSWYSALPSSACGSGHHASPTIKNGSIVQSGNASPFTHAIWIGQGNGISGGTISDVTISIQARGTQAIFGDYPGVGWTIENNTINDKVTNIQHDGQIPLSARSQFQGVAIKFDNGTSGGNGDVITGNTINGSPQGGIVDSNPNTHITNNVVTLSSYYSNDYGITVMADGQVVSGNVISGRGRGIDAESSNFTLSGNTVTVHEEANNSEYGGCELDGSDGIRIKNYQDHTPSSGWTIENNTVTVAATYCQAHGLRFTDLGTSVSGSISNNSFTTNGTKGDFALSFSGVDQPAFTYTKNAFAGSTCAQIDDDGTTDGANTSVQSGQTWSCGTQAVLDSDLTADGSGTYSQALTLADTPSNHTITCGPYARGLIKLGSSVSKKCSR